MVVLGESLWSQQLHYTGSEDSGRDEKLKAVFWRQDCIAPHPHPGFLPGFGLRPVQVDGTVDPDAVHQEVSSAGHPQLHPP